MAGRCPSIQSRNLTGAARVPTGDRQRGGIMRARQHLTYANVMATIAVFGVVAGGGAYAASKIDTPDIASKAVTAKKLDGQAVKTGKLRSGAVTSDKLAEGAVETRNLSQNATLAMAGVSSSEARFAGGSTGSAIKCPRSSSRSRGYMTSGYPGSIRRSIPPSTC
jgi:hypothetical protein